MKLKYLFLSGAVLLTGCQGLKERQLDAYIGDTQTKVYYQNTTELYNQIPKERQVFFKSVDDAMKEGYQSSQEAGKQPAEDDQ